MINVIASQKKEIQKIQKRVVFRRKLKKNKTFRNAKVQCINYNVVKRIKNQRNEACRNRKKNLNFLKKRF